MASDKKKYDIYKILSKASNIIEKIDKKLDLTSSMNQKEKEIEITNKNNTVNSIDKIDLLEYSINNKNVEISEENDFIEEEADETILNMRIMWCLKKKLLAELTHKKSSLLSLIEVTDKKLLSYSGGIVQGMSGSPIIQNNRIIGAVTHVFVNNPTKGYGVFIEWMVDEGMKLSNN